MGTIQIAWSWACNIIVYCMVVYVLHFCFPFLSCFFVKAPEEEGGKPFQCPICGLVIKRKSYWKRHMVIHTGLKSHQCPLCPFRCARKDNLKSHMKVRLQLHRKLKILLCSQYKIIWEDVASRQPYSMSVSLF